MQAFSEEETRNWLREQERRVSSAAVAIYDGDRVLIVKAGYKSYWTFPGGVIDADEAPHEAAVREVQEEAGISLPADEITFVSVAVRSIFEEQTYRFLFEYKGSETLFDTVNIDHDEIVEYAVVSRQQIIDADREYAPSVRDWALGKTGYLIHE